MEGIVLVCNGAVQRSDGQAKADTDLIHPVTRECSTDAAGGLPMPLCHTTAKATAQTLRQLLQERLGFPGAIGIGKVIRFWMRIMRLHAVRRHFGVPWRRSRSVPD